MRKRTRPLLTYHAKGWTPDDELVRKYAHRPRIHGRAVRQVYSVLVVLGLVLVGATEHLHARVAGQSCNVADLAGN